MTLLFMQKGRRQQKKLQLLINEAFPGGKQVLLKVRGKTQLEKFPDRTAIS